MRQVPPIKQTRTETPEQRLDKLKTQLSQNELITQLSDHEGYRAIINIAEAEAKRRRVSRDALNWEDSADTFLAHKERSSYATGYIQGVEFILNVLKAAPVQNASLRAEMKEIEDEIKAAKKS